MVNDSYILNNCDIHTVVWIRDMDTGIYNGKSNIGFWSEGMQDTSADHIPPEHVTKADVRSRIERCIGETEN